MRALTKVGGVFFDRLDEPVIRFVAEAASGDAVSAAPALGQSWDTRVLVEPQVAGAGFDLPTGKPKIIGHMRNREYLPHLMRFAQRDPNATGQLVMAAVEFGGLSIAHRPSGMELTQLFGDGPNLYGYLTGRPRGRADSTGLDSDDDVEDGYDAIDAYDDFNDLLALASPIPGPSSFIQGALSSLVGEYADNLGADLDWAMDWSQADDAHSRGDNKWVPAAIGRGLYGAFDIGMPFSDSTLNPLGSFASSSSASASGSFPGGQSKIRVLPPTTVLVKNGVQLSHYYGRDGGRPEHANPVHLNVKSDGQPNTRIRPSGAVVDPKRDRPLTAKERKVVKDHKSLLNKSVKQIQKWFRAKPGINPNRRR